LDSIQRGQLLSGELKQLIEEYGLRGETANPTIFEHALNGPDGAYDEQLRELIRQGLDANAIYERIATDDVRRPPFPGTPGARRTRATPLVGFDVYQESSLSRRDVWGGSYWAGYDQHHTVRDARCLSRSRLCRTDPGPGG
jgi:hypothetical protein